jgi:hypothetical protein
MKIKFMEISEAQAKYLWSWATGLLLSFMPVGNDR